MAYVTNRYCIILVFDHVTGMDGLATLSLRSSECDSGGCFWGTGCRDPPGVAYGDAIWGGGSRVIGIVSGGVKLTHRRPGSGE